MHNEQFDSISKFYQMNASLVFLNLISLYPVKTLIQVSFLFVCFQAAKEKQKIRGEEIQIDVVERKKQIEVEEKEVARKDKELVATVKRPAEAESYRVETIAQGKRCKKKKILKVRLILYSPTLSTHSVSNLGLINRSHFLTQNLLTLCSSRKYAHPP